MPSVPLTDPLPTQLRVILAELAEGCWRPDGIPLAVAS